MKNRIIRHYEESRFYRGDVVISIRDKGDFYSLGGITLDIMY